MKIISYNVNGIRAAIGKGFADWLLTESPDVICLQETKAQPEQIDLALFEKLGYNGYFHSAQKKGYSGVGILCKQKPDKVVVGMNNERYDAEGRVLRADFGELTVVSVYVPSGSSGDERQAFKMDFLEVFFLSLKHYVPKDPNWLYVAITTSVTNRLTSITRNVRWEYLDSYRKKENGWTDMKQWEWWTHSVVLTLLLTNTAGGALEEVPEQEMRAGALTTIGYLLP